MKLRRLMRQQRIGMRIHTHTHRHHTHISYMLNKLYKIDSNMQKGIKKSKIIILRWGERFLDLNQILKLVKL